MRRLAIGLAALLLAACNPMEVMDETSGAIEEFHEHWNAGDVDAIWNSTDPEMRDGLTQDEFRATFVRFTETLGNVESSEREGFNLNTNNGVTTTVITMNTQFANGEGVEEFTFRDQGDAQRLLSYFVESEALNNAKPEGNTTVSPAGESVAGKSDAPSQGDAQIGVEKPEKEPAD